MTNRLYNRKKQWILQVWDAQIHRQFSDGIDCHDFTHTWGHFFSCTWRRLGECVDFCCFDLRFAEIIPRKMGRIWCHMRIIPFMYPFLLEMSIRSPFAKNQFLGAKLACKYWVLQKERRHCFEDFWGNRVLPVSTITSKGTYEFLPYFQATKFIWFADHCNQTLSGNFFRRQISRTIATANRNYSSWLLSHVQINHVWKDSFHGHRRPVRNTTKWDDYPSQGIHWRKGCFWQKWMEHGATTENCHARINVPKKKRIQSSGYYWCLEHRNAGHCETKPNLQLSPSQTTIFWDAVDGRNPAPVD